MYNIKFFSSNLYDLNDSMHDIFQVMPRWTATQRQCVWVQSFIYSLQLKQKKNYNIYQAFYVTAWDVNGKHIGIHKRLMKISSKALISPNTTERTVFTQEIFDLNEETDEAID